MSKTAVIRSRIQFELKSDVETILSQLGLTPSDAIQMLFHQIRLRKGIPFDVSLPNELTIKTLKASRKGIGVKRFSTKADLFRDLGL